ncbi:MAG: DUF2130 domain-containing protein [Candidatus Omnitrophica bacterium]|nr:DUF2130 domain-containing protein [Candidatus Omnitrophota bacterium]
MSEPTITCPECKAEIKLTESLAAPLVESIKREYESKLTKKDSDIAKREASLREQMENLSEAKDNIDEEIAGRVKEEAVKITANEAKKAKMVLGTKLDQKSKEVTDLQDVLAERDKKLAEAQKAQAELIKKQRELDDAKREMDLTIEKRVQEGLSATRDQARKEVEGELNLKVAEKEQTITSMQKQIENLKRRAEQGSQQLQGEVQELELESLLGAQFPFDNIEPVPKGEFGGDTLQRVINSNGQACGTILWESKRTKNWSDGWLTKLRDDQRTAKAEIAVLISQTLPKDVDIFAMVGGVWVTHLRSAIPVAIILRNTLIEVASSRQAVEGQQTKTELIYHYLTGPRFKQRVEAIVEAFSSMKEDLDKEKKAIMKQWSKRETQIDRVMQSTVGMYGDLQGIAGKTLQEIEGLEMKVLEEGGAE